MSVHIETARGIAVRADTVWSTRTYEKYVSFMALNYLTPDER